MRKILYITGAHPKGKSGAEVLGRMHNEVVRELKDSDVFTIYINNGEIESNKTQLKIGPSKGYEKVLAVLCGYTPNLNIRIVKRIMKTIREKRTEIVYIDNSLSGNLVRKIKKQFSQVKVVTFFHDIQSNKMKEEKGHSCLRKCILPIYYANEKKTVLYADRKIVLNDRDKKLYFSIFGKEPDAQAPICVAFPGLNENPMTHRSKEKLKILFVGVDYGPNVLGLRWFVSEVLPKIKCDYMLQIVGFRMEKYREEWENTSRNVKVIGTVDSLTPYYESADLVIGPIFEGGGMKVKTAEAFVYGKTYVGSTESLEGYWEAVPNNLKNEYIYKADSVAEFVKCIELVSEKTYLKRVPEIRVWAHKHYTKNAIKNIYENVFDSLS